MHYAAPALTYDIVDSTVDSSGGVVLCLPTCYTPRHFEVWVDLLTHHVCHCQPCKDAISLC